MTRPQIIWILSAVTTLLGCATFKSGDSPNDKKNVEIDTTTILSGTVRGDSPATLQIRLNQLDSVKAPDTLASQLFLLTLDNFIAVGSKDSRVNEIKLWKANHLFNKGQYDSARTMYEQLIKDEPAGQIRADASQMVAQILIRTGESRKAWDWYKSRLGDKDTTTSKDARERMSQALYLQAEKLEKKGKLQQASQTYAEVSEAFPQSDIAPTALYNAGILREKLKDWDSALAIYNRFTDKFYQNDNLPSVLFRIAKCSEMKKNWLGAGEQYQRLAKAYPEHEKAEPALYNAGFAFANAKDADRASKAYEAYSERYPQNEASPNLLFRAAEIQAEAKNWDKVSELQSLFTRRYGGDRGRQVQARCLGGLAAMHQEKFDLAKQNFEQALAIYVKGGIKDPNARIYAAEAQHSLGELAGRTMTLQKLRPDNFDADLDLKTRQLKLAASLYVKVVDFRIAEWGLRSAHSLGLLFENYGREVLASTRRQAKNPDQRMEYAIQGLETLGAAVLEAAEHYQQAITIANKQSLHNRYSEEANLKSYELRIAYQTAVDSVWNQADAIWAVNGLPNQKAVTESLEKLSYLNALQVQAAQVSAGFFKLLNGYLPSTKVDSSQAIRAANGFNVSPDSTGKDWIVHGLFRLSQKYQGLIDTVRSAQVASDSIQEFFFKAKLLCEGLPPIQKQTQQVFDAGLQVAAERMQLASPWADSLRIAAGRHLYLTAKSFDLLANRALAQPPIPVDAPVAKQKTFEQKFEELGYILQDSAMVGYKTLVYGVKPAKVAEFYGELALVRLFQTDPDKWSNGTSEAAKGPLLPTKPWNSEIMTKDRYEFIKGLQVAVPNFKP